MPKDTEKEYAAKIREHLLHNYVVEGPAVVAKVRAWDKLVRVGHSAKTSAGEVAAQIARYERLKKKT